MDRSVKVKKRLILTGLAVLLLVDLALAAYSYRTALVTRRPMQELQAEAKKLQLLRADIDRADRIRHDLPATVAECDRFEGSLLPASTGASAITTELDDLAAKSRVQLQSIAFHHKNIGRNLTMVDLDVSVAGDYASIVRFMNGLQRSKTAYAVGSLALQTEGQGGAIALHVALQMKTYFRAAA